MSCFFIFTGITLEDESADNSNIPEFSPCHFCAVDASPDISTEIFFRKQILHIRIINGNGLIAQQFKTIIIHSERKSDRCNEADTISQQSSHGFMHQPAFKRVYKKMEPILCFNLLNQQFIFPGNM